MLQTKKQTDGPKRKTTWKRLGQRERICTLKVCGIRDKDPNIVEFMKKWKISVLGISDCRLKGNGTTQTQDNYELTWSGVSTRERANHGVAFVMQPEQKRCWKQILSQKEQ